MQRKSSQTTVVTWIKSYHYQLWRCFFSSTPHRNHHLPTKMENKTPPAQRPLPIAPRQYRRGSSPASNTAAPDCQSSEHPSVPTTNTPKPQGCHPHTFWLPPSHPPPSLLTTAEHLPPPTATYQQRTLCASLVEDTYTSSSAHLLRGVRRSCYEAVL